MVNKVRRCKINVISTNLLHYKSIFSVTSTDILDIVVGWVLKCSFLVVDDTPKIPCVGDVSKSVYMVDVSKLLVAQISWNYLKP